MGSPEDVNQELEAVFAVNQSEPLNLDETDEDVSETDIDPNESYEDEEDEELVEVEVSPGDVEKHEAVFAKSDKAPVDFDALLEAEPEMVEEKDGLSEDDDGDHVAVHAKNVSAPINFDEAAEVEAKELVEEETEDDSSEEAEKSEEAEYATGESPPIDFT